MNKQQYNSLPVMEQLEYVNSELNKGESLRSISKNLSMSKTTIRDRFKKIGYIFNADKSRYYKDDTLVIQEYKSMTKPSPRACKEGNEPIKSSNALELQKYKDDLLQLINNKDDILKMLEDYKSNVKVIQTSKQHNNNNNLALPQININNLNEEVKGNITNKSIKVYSEVYELFNNLCNEHNSIKKQDLISLALLEFYNKYK